jgi:hypothetical protein
MISQYIQVVIEECLQILWKYYQPLLYVPAYKSDKVLYSRYSYITEIVILKRQESMMGLTIFCMCF